MALSALQVRLPLSPARAPGPLDDDHWHRADQLMLTHSSPSAKFASAPDDQPHTPLTPPLTPASSNDANVAHSSPSPTDDPLSRVFASRLSLATDASPHADPGKTPKPEFELQPEPKDGRFLMVAGVPRETSPADLRSALEPCGDLLGVHVGLLAADGLVVLAFHDTREAASAKLLLRNESLLGAHRLSPRYMSPSDFEKRLGNQQIVSDTRGDLYITVDGGRIDNSSLQRFFAHYGELKDFTRIESQQQQQVFCAEYYDCRAAAAAYAALNGRSFFGRPLQLVLAHCESSPPTFPFPHQSSPSGPIRYRQSAHQPSEPNSPLISNRLPFPNGPQETNSSPFHGHLPLPLLLPPASNRRISTGSVTDMLTFPSLHQSTSEQDLRRKAAAQAGGESYEAPHPRRTSNTYGFDSMRKSNGIAHRRPRAISESSASPPPINGMRLHDEQQPQPESNGLSAGMPTFEDPFAPVEQSTGYGSYQTGSSRPTSSLATPYSIDPAYWVAQMAHYAPMTPMPVQPPYSPYVSAENPYVSPSRRYLAHAHAYPSSVYGDMQMPVSPLSHHPHGAYTNGHAHPPSSVRAAIDVTREPTAEKNQIDLHRIACGQDTRTTVMIKNIPNKLNDRDLIEYIGKVCPRRIDFLYLRMDFQNGCNVGYAFVNFIAVEDLLKFASAKLGVKWNMFSSEKVLQMSYANYQGKEALVEKFKNSCVMDERESWRPKIFYSSGPRQGLPEPFPAPTHLRRKERSSQNRGALYVPGAAGSFGEGIPPRTLHHGPGRSSGLYHSQGRGTGAHMMRF